MLLAVSCSSGRFASKEELVCVQIIDRNNLTKTVSHEERLGHFNKVDFTAPQPYKQVVRVYSNKETNQKNSKITSYHPNGSLWQYLEVIDTRAYGQYKEYWPNGKLSMHAYVIGGPASLAREDQKKWLFDGETMAYDEDGNLIGRFVYLKGILEKEGFHYYPTGKIKKQIPYLHGEIEGEEITYFKNGQIKSKITFQQSQKEGPAFSYFKNGKIKLKESYQKNNLLDGYYFNEKQELISSVTDGKGFKSFIKNKQLKQQVEYLDGKPFGLVKLFGLQEKLIRIYHQNNGKKEGEEIEFYQENQPKISLQWADDQIQGVVKTWHENGQMASLAEWQGNKKNGLSSAWYEDGSLMLVEEYENNQIQKGQYYKKGEKKPVSTIVEGKGSATLFDKHGNFLKKITYVQGQPEISQ